MDQSNKMAKAGIYLTSIRRFPERRLEYRQSERFFRDIPRSFQTIPEIFP
jgi:hypothetical protein